METSSSFFALHSSYSCTLQFFGSPVLRCRRRFLLPRRQVGVGLCWLRRFSMCESRDDVAIFSSFSLDGVGLCRNLFFPALFPASFPSPRRRVGVGLCRMRRLSGLVTIPEAATTRFLFFRLTTSNLSKQLAPMLASNFLLSIARRT